MEQVSAVLLPTLSWTWAEADPVHAVPALAHREVATEAIEWQQVSSLGSAAELEAAPMPIRRSVTWNGVRHVIEPGVGTPPREANRLLEVHGLMGLFVFEGG